ncbi:MAG: hypothetical protein U5L04_01700 [Trueperaceae bacterium]|nr:hypothetical protein [Trueperaceae bacterium]
MTGIARGEDYSLYILDPDGELLKTIQPNSMTAQPDENTERQERCGTREQPPRQTFMGWSGDAEFEKEDFALDDLLGKQMDAYFNGEPVGSVDIIQNKYIPKLGSTKTYRYIDAKFSVNESAGGQKDAVTQSYTWTAKRRVEV